MEVSDLIVKFLLVVGVFAIALVVAMYVTYGERKVAAFLQDRLGPTIRTIWHTSATGRWW